MKRNQALSSYKSIGVTVGDAVKTVWSSSWCCSKVEVINDLLIDQITAAPSIDDNRECGFPNHTLGMKKVLPLIGRRCFLKSEDASIDQAKWIGEGVGVDVDLVLLGHMG